MKRAVVFAALAVILPLSVSAEPVTLPITFHAGEFGHMFQIVLGDPNGTIHASTAPGNVDTELFLFNSAWQPLWSVDDVFGPPYTPGAALNYTTVAGDTPDPGVYHLLVTIWNTVPLDQNYIPMFPDSNIFGGGPSPWAATETFQGVFDGPYQGVTTDITLTYSSGNLAGGDNGISLTPEAIPTPEPASVLLFGSGALGLVTVFRRRK